MSYQRILLAGRSGIPGVEETLAELISHLKPLCSQIFCTESTHKLIQSDAVTPLPEADLAGRVDLLVVVGGDGSLLQAAHLATRHDLPVIGINRGRLGFLTDICPHSLDQIDAVLKGDHNCENRFIIQATLQQPSGELPTPAQIALNDVVLQPGGAAQMIAFDVFVDDQLVYEHRADGLIIATPTGSTAYALSGGGPILQPQLPALAIVPMFPHTLSSRPIVVSANNTIRIVVSPNQKTRPLLSCDGNIGTPVEPGGEITVTLHNKRLKLLHPKSYNYYKTLRDKLNWEQSARRKTD